MTSPLQQKLKISGPTVITANRLIDGEVVWLTPTQSWSRDLSDAQVESTSDAVLALLTVAAGDENVAVGAYPARVSTADGAPVPTTMRERIRVYGPTIDFPGAA